MRFSWGCCNGSHWNRRAYRKRGRGRCARCDRRSGRYCGFGCNRRSRRRSGSNHGPGFHLRNNRRLGYNRTGWRLGSNCRGLRRWRRYDRGRWSRLGNDLARSWLCCLGSSRPCRKRRRCNGLPGSDWGHWRGWRRLRRNCWRNNRPAGGQCLFFLALLNCLEHVARL